jgi:hypothetical protein
MRCPNCRRSTTRPRAPGCSCWASTSATRSAAHPRTSSATPGSPTRRSTTHRAGRWSPAISPTSRAWSAPPHPPSAPSTGDPPGQRSVESGGRCCPVARLADHAGAVRPRIHRGLRLHDDGGARALRCHAGQRAVAATPRWCHHHRDGLGFPRGVSRAAAGDAATAHPRDGRWGAPLAAPSTAWAGRRV